jgi:hypothetical protein
MIEATPSRIFDPDASRADGKVAFVQDAPAVMTAQTGVAGSRLPVVDAGNR